MNKIMPMNSFSHTSNTTTANARHVVPYISEADKLQFSENINKWMQVDKQLQMYNEKIKSLRETKTQISRNIIEYMENKNIANNKIKFKTGELGLHTKKDYSPLTFTYVESCLTKAIDNPSYVQYIMQLLKNNRSVKESQDIKIIRYMDA
jgi:uncharacterized coiled-coil DUF342 family protein